MGSLTSDLLGQLTSGFTALHAHRVETRHWRRLGADPEYSKAVADAFRQLHFKLAGERFVLKFPSYSTGITRTSLLQKIGARKNVILLEDGLIEDLSIDGIRRSDPTYLPAFRGKKVTMVQFRIGYHVTMTEALEEFQSRGLQPANTEDALLYLLASPERISRADAVAHVAVLGAMLSKPPKGFEGVEGPMVLSFGRLLSGDERMTLDEVKKGFSGRTHFLAKLMTRPLE